MDKKIIVVDRNTSGNYFYELRKKAKLTQTEASELSGVSQQLISLLECEGIRSGTRWNKMGDLLRLYAKHNAPSLFAMVCNNGDVIDSVSEVYTDQDLKNEKAVMQQRLREFLNTMDSAAT